MIVEKNIPMPPVSNRRGRKSKYPFNEMDVGDSLLVVGKNSSTSLCPAYNAAMQLGMRTGKKFTARQEEGQEGMVRIWRIA